MRGSFYGWYFKCQSQTQTLSIIPALHEECSSIQFITEEKVWNVTFPKEAFCRTRKQIKIGENYFNENGLLLSVNTDEVQIEGKLKFGKITPLKYDIMGPFAFVPFMECRHSVWSMFHKVWGVIVINGKKYKFEGDNGYWEGDRGTSFPKTYAWTHCFFEGKTNPFPRQMPRELKVAKADEECMLYNGSLMLSVAEIPIGRIRFTGVIGVINWEGKEYRFATYLGARVLQKTNRKLWIKQGRYELEAWLLEEQAHPLNAPVNGKMSRTIHESAKCRAYYCLRKEEKVLFSFESEQASFEYCME